MKIILEASELIAGTSATYRYTKELVLRLPLLGSNFSFTLFSYGRQKPNISVHDLPNLRMAQCKMPRRIASFLWKHFNWPLLERWTGSANLCHYLGHPLLIPNNNIPSIITLHGLAPLVVPYLLPRHYTNEFQSLLSTAAVKKSWFIAVSEKTKEEFISFFPNMDSNRIKVIPLGISSEFYPRPKDEVIQKLKERFGIQYPYFLYVGQCSNIKNTTRLIEAFNLFSRSASTKFNLVIAGKNNGITLQENIVLLNDLPQDIYDLPLLYNGAKALIHPSLYEGWASPPLEAMACETPVITSNISSLPETVGDAAFFINPYDIKEISVAMERIISDDILRETLQKKGLSRAKEFTWERCVTATLAWYEEICKQTGN